MTIADISRAYQLILALAEKSNKYSESELSDLQNEVKGASNELRGDLQNFLDKLEKTEQTIKGDIEDEIVSELIDLRMSVMGLATDFDNLTDAISKLFEKHAIRVNRAID